MEAAHRGHVDRHPVRDRAAVGRDRIASAVPGLVGRPSVGGTASPETGDRGPRPGRGRGGARRAPRQGSRTARPPRPRGRPHARPALGGRPAPRGLPTRSIGLTMLATDLLIALVLLVGAVATAYFVFASFVFGAGYQP